MKKCTKCAIEKNDYEFSKDSRTPNGLQPKCKMCNKLYRDMNIQKRHEYDKQWKIDHPNHIKEWLLKNPTYKKEWYESHPNYNKEYQENNAEDNLRKGNKTPEEWQNYLDNCPNP